MERKIGDILKYFEEWSSKVLEKFDVTKVLRTTLKAFFTKYLGNAKRFWCNNSSFQQTQLSQPAFTCSKLIKETVEQGVKYVQS